MYGKTNRCWDVLNGRPRARQAPLAAKLAVGPGLDGQRVTTVPLAFRSQGDVCTLLTLELELVAHPL